MNAIDSTPNIDGVPRLFLSSKPVPSTFGFFVPPHYAQAEHGD
jgi:hypothetical protein